MTRRMTATLLVLLSVGSLMSGSAGAADDAGLRSVFAHGAGERALALGGAYGAVSGDPTTLFWNPAGLAGLERVSFAAAHTNLIGMGFQEQFGVLAVPSWRLGTFALSMRRFGVDGIEERNDRGTLLSDDLKDVESELSLGYGLGLGPAWQVGAAFKIQRQELAGHSGGGMGLDAGFLVRPAMALGDESDWARGLSLGVTFRNLIEPTIDLVNDEVRDPSAVRVGGALDMPLGRQMGALLTVDVEKTSEMDARLHAGVEVTLIQVLALRAGTNNGNLSAGLGAAWRGVAVHYAFEDNPLETVHRMGMGLAFGPTVDERRQAALDRQEADLRQRLDKAFAEEERRRVTAATDSVEAALADGRWDVALERVRSLEVIAPAYPSAKAFEATALLGQGKAAEQAGDLGGAVVAYQGCLRVDPNRTEAVEGLARVTAESARRTHRDETLKALFLAGMNAFAAGELDRARDQFGQALALSPDDKDLRELANHVDESIRERDEVAVALAAAQAAVERAESRAVSGPTAAAAEAPREAPVQSEPPAPTGYASLSASRQREVSDLYQQGVSAAATGRRDDAIRYWELVAASAPDYQQVGDHLKQEYQARGMEAFAGDRLDLAIEIWEKALKLDPQDPRTRGYLARAQEYRARIRTIRSSN